MKSKTLEQIEEEIENILDGVAPDLKIRILENILEKRGYQVQMIEK